MSIPVQREDCEVAHTTEELIVWIESVKDQFHADDRIEKILIKAFFEEILPLGDLARHYYLGRPGLYLRSKIGNQSYDAEIIDTSSGNEHIKRVEFTSAFRNYNLALRLEHFDRHGDVYWTGPAWRDGTKASGGQVQVVPEFVDHQILLDNLFDSIEAAVENKLSMPYVADTMLAVVFNDFILYRDTDLPQLPPRFCDIILASRCSTSSTVSSSLGSQVRYFWSLAKLALLT
jgi:hypothetical protein